LSEALTAWPDHCRGEGLVERKYGIRASVYWLQENPQGMAPREGDIVQTLSRSLMLVMYIKDGVEKCFFDYVPGLW
jgi:hypothetical protein